MYCGAGGSAAGYAKAGFDIIGVDKKLQKNYPYSFYHGDAIEYLKDNYMDFDAVHASPPCQLYSTTRSLNGGLSEETDGDNEDLVDPTRDALLETKLPYVIENVEGAPLNHATILCGAMFGIRTYRHRLFETNFFLEQIRHNVHRVPTARLGRMPKDGEFMTIVGNYAGADLAKSIMGIDWMTRKELAQAIPPVYTEYVGKTLITMI